MITYTQKATVRCSAPVAGEDSAPRQCEATCEAVLRLVAGKDGVTRLFWVVGLPNGWSCHRYVQGVLRPLPGSSEHSNERETGVYLGCEEHATQKR